VDHARILLVDDHQEVRDIVVHLLEKDFEVVGAVEDGRAFLEAALKLKPDLCVVDISIPIVSGIEALTHLKTKGLSTKVVILTIHEDSDFVRAAFSYGASAYVVKSRMGTDLVVAIREVLAGRTFVSSSVKTA
jgi:DNA-binding NarL/FixJ family response regulator